MACCSSEVERTKRLTSDGSHFLFQAGLAFNHHSTNPGYCQISLIFLKSVTVPEVVMKQSLKSACFKVTTRGTKNVLEREGERKAVFWH